MSASRKLILAWVTVMAAASAAVASNGDGPSVRDEWAPVDRVVLSPDPTAGIITPWGKTIIQEALKNAVKPVIFDGDAAKQQIILQDLKNAGVIQKDSDVHIFNNPLPGGWPRDYAPMTVFKGHTKGAALTGSVFESEAKTNTIVQNTATALSMTGINVPQVKFPTGYDPPQLPFSLDGGDWMTTNGGKRLVTTTNIYEQNGDGAGQMLQDVKNAVHKTLKDFFGVTETIALTPLAEKEGGYAMANSHVDLQVRTLPDGKYIVAKTPVGDAQHDILEQNVQALKDAGVPANKIIRIDNAPEPGAKKYFKSYTNTLFLNKTALIPKYGDAAADAAAKQAYEDALNAGLPANSPKRWKVVQVDASQAITCSGAIRCAAKEIPRTPCKKKGKKAASKSNPYVSFDAATGELTFSPGEINFLGDADATETDTIYDTDLFMGATLIIDGLELDKAMSTTEQYAFVGGTVTVTNGLCDLLLAEMPVFTIRSVAPEESLLMYGVLGEYDAVSPGLSRWFDDFTVEVLDIPELLPDFYAAIDADLVDLTGGFTADLPVMELDSMGLLGNDNCPVPEPTCAIMFAVITMALLRIRVKRTLNPS